MPREKIWSIYMKWMPGLPEYAENKYLFTGAYRKVVSVKSGFRASLYEISTRCRGSKIFREYIGDSDKHRWDMYRTLGSRNWS